MGDPFSYTVDPITGKTRYTSEKAGQGKRLAELAFGKKMLEWEKLKHLGLEARNDHTFAELVDWYLELPRVKAKKTYRDDVMRANVLKETFGASLARDIKPAMVEVFQHELLKRPCKINKTTYTGICEQGSGCYEKDLQPGFEGRTGG